MRNTMSPPFSSKKWESKIKVRIMYKPNVHLYLKNQMLKCKMSLANEVLTVYIDIKL